MRGTVFLIAQAATIGLAGAVDAVAKVGYPIFSALAMGALVVYQERQFRSDRAAAELAFREERKGDRDGHLAAIGTLASKIGEMRDELLRRGRAA